MTFLELASAIDQIEQALSLAKKELERAEGNLVAFKAKQAEALRDEEVLVGDIRAVLISKDKALHDLFDQMGAKMPGSVPSSKPRVEPSGAELKATYQGGMKYRGNLG